MSLHLADHDIARIAHEANRELQRTLADPRIPVAPEWESLPLEMRRGITAGVRYTRDNPDVTPEQSHENWTRDKLENGWRYGAIKDAMLKTHPCLVSYEQLPASDKVKDALFLAIVRALGAE